MTFIKTTISIFFLSIFSFPVFGFSESQACQKCVEDQGEKGDKKGEKAELRYDEGFWLEGGGERMNIGGYIQADGHFFTDRHNGHNGRHNEHYGHSTFFIRRARLFMTGTLDRLFGYMLMASWDRHIPDLHYAWIDTQTPLYARIRVGLFKEPFSAQALYPNQYLEFNERSIGVNNYLQIEDIGVMLFGKLLDDTIEYGAGIFNGRGNHLDNNSDKEYVGRIVVTPFAKLSPIFKGLYIGFSGSIGRHTEELTDTGFKTAARTLFYRWEGTEINPVTVDDDRIRWGADLEWIIGSGVLRTEYLHVDWGNIGFNHQHRHFKGYSWYVEGAYILTGEKKIRHKRVVPKHNLDFKCHYGAWEIAARYEVFQASKNLLNAGFAVGADRAEGYTLGINGYFNEFVTLRVSYQHLNFSRSFLVDSHCINKESVILTRLQAVF